MSESSKKKVTEKNVCPIQHVSLLLKPKKEDCESAIEAGTASECTLAQPAVEGLEKEGTLDAVEGAEEDAGTQPVNSVIDDKGVDCTATAEESKLTNEEIDALLMSIYLNWNILWICMHGHKTT